MPSHPHPATAARLLTDFIAMPVGMHPVQHSLLIRQLHGIVVNGAAATPPAPQAWREGETPPWEKPGYAVDAATGIALLEISGPLVKGYDDITCYYWQLASIDRLAREFDEIGARADVRALVVNLRTPGGMSTGMPELAAQLAALGQRILVVTHTSDMAASNGMRLAVAGTQFCPTASACVGCIGTYIALYNQTKLLEEWGIKLELYRSGKYKAIGLAGKDTTTEEAAFIQAEVMRSNHIFTDFVRARRPGVPDDAMEGQWFDGAQAVDYGLADTTVTGLPELIRQVAATVA